MLSDKEIKEIYGKSVFDMTTEELVENDLVHNWVELVDASVEDDE